MNAKRVMVGVGLALFAGLAVAIGWQHVRARRDGSTVAVDEVAAHPERFTGAIRVAGRVAKIEPSGGAFVLGCEGACVAVPVKFDGALPTVGREVVVHGQIQQAADGRRVFVADKVAQK